MRKKHDKIRAHLVELLTQLKDVAQRLDNIKKEMQIIE